MAAHDTTEGIEKILSTLEALDRRMASVETRMTDAPQQSDQRAEAPKSVEAEDNDALEFRIGSNWLARAGILLLTVGFIFLLTLPYADSPAWVPSVIGVVLAGMLAALARFWHASLKQFSTYLHGGALAVLYVAVLRLSHLTSDPLISSTPIAIALLLAATAACFVAAWRGDSIVLMGLSLTFGYVTAIVSDSTWVVFGLLVAMSGISAWVSIQRWQLLLWYAVMLTYATHLLWFLGNPAMGHTMQMVQGNEVNLLFLLAYAGIFATGTLHAPREEDGSEPLFATFLSFLNTAMGFGCFFVIAEFSAGEAKVPMYVVAAVVLIGIAAMHWVRRQSVFSTFHYAMTGYLAMTVAIVHAAAIPDMFLWLVLQSLLVIATAVWFRSRVIVVTNFVLYVGFFISYIVVADAISGIGLVFGVVALVSARILNWQRDRLSLKTDAMRTAYLVAGTVMIPLSLHALLDATWVPLSWVVVAALYYALSRLLQNTKYRMMALVTLLGTVAYVLLIALSDVAIEYRVLSFVAVGIVLLVISALYFRAAQRTRNAGAPTVS